MFSEEGNAIIVQLDNSDVFEYQNFTDEQWIQDLLTIAAYEPEILSASTVPKMNAICALLLPHHASLRQRQGRTQTQQRFAIAQATE